MIRRFSSRQGEPYNDYLSNQLEGARNYWRIAGYFTVSILEIAGDAIGKLTGKARIVCNSQLTAREFQATGGRAMNREWGAYWQDAEEAARERLAQLHELLKSSKLEIRVAPDDRFGLVHGKAGLVERGDGSQVTFLGSNNETRQAWRGNYELMWEDDSHEAVAWVMKEFDALWDVAVPLSDFVIRDVERLAYGKPVNVRAWREDPSADDAVTTNDLYRKAQGLRGYQQQFVEMAFRHHALGAGARFLLADQVGLGKTPQMALASALMGLFSDKPVLVVVPKTLVEQWQFELLDLLGLPSARWESQRRSWITENEEMIPSDLGECPRRIGILSQGLVVHSSEARETLIGLRGGYACIVIDEAHRARVQTKGKSRNPNKLMKFAWEIAPRTRSFILGTATPVQLDAIEAFDLIEALDGNTQWILGTPGSMWRTHAENGIGIASEIYKPESEREAMAWLGDPFPHRFEGETFERIRHQRNLSGIAINPSDEGRLLQDNNIKRELRNLPDHSPYVRRIVQRTREDLERAGLLPRIDVDAFDEIIPLPEPLQAAYEAAQEYCRLLGKRKRGMGFLETLLLRRIGSSFYAGLRTSERLLKNELAPDAAEEDDDDENLEVAELLVAEEPERQRLAEVINYLKDNLNLDAKFARLKEFLFDRGWMDRGCLVFSQYYETASHFAERLSREEPMNGQEIPVYAGEGKAGIWLDGIWYTEFRMQLKERSKSGDFPVFFGTDAASEGLNLQYFLSTLINLDAPWSPTRLDQRTGRIRRIGQPKSNVLIASFRYQGSVEERVWQRLSTRYQQIYNLLGTLPDVLRSAWVHEALDEQQKAEEIIDGVPEAPPLRLKNRLKDVEQEWGYSKRYLKKGEAFAELRKGWNKR